MRLAQQRRERLGFTRAAAPDCRAPFRGGPAGRAFAKLCGSARHARDGNVTPYESCSRDQPRPGLSDLFICRARGRFLLMRYCVLIGSSTASGRDDGPRRRALSVLSPRRPKCEMSHGSTSVARTSDRLDEHPGTGRGKTSSARFTPLRRGRPVHGGGRNT